jgi:hypothetical protein
MKTMFAVMALVSLAACGTNKTSVADDSTANMPEAGCCETKASEEAAKAGCTSGQKSDCSAATTCTAKPQG